MKGFHSELYYNIALCLYESSELDESLTYCEEIIERAYREHPELRVTEATKVFDTDKQRAATLL